MTSVKLVFPERFASVVKTDVLLAPYTTMGVGGRAQYFMEPRNREDIVTALSWARENQVPWTVFGGGSNCLISDLGISGLVIRVGDGLQTIIQPRPDLVRVGAGVQSKRLLKYARDMGLGGVEILAGIPGSIGGAIAGNAGSGHHGILDRIKAIRAVTTEKEYVWSSDELVWGYRLLELPVPGIITDIDIKVLPTEIEEIRRKIDSIIKSRKGQPDWHGTAGCIFKNPLGEAAGRLIDSCGLKGRSIGSVSISHQHANFIICKPGSKSSDVWNLMMLVRTIVKEETGFLLEPEICLLGDWEGTGFHEWD